MNLHENYFTSKYNLTAPHSEVIQASECLSEGNVLDLGCGNGRNSLYLAQKGFHVAAWDKNPESINKLNTICQNESINTITTNIVDLNNINFSGNYNLIISTVVFMFLNSSSIPKLIENMKTATIVGGYNLIVAAMDTKDMPCTMNFPFTFKTDELRNYYHSWSIKKYNEDIGSLHKTDKDGNRIKLRFATILAQKN